MDLTVLNRTPVGAAARGVGRVTFGALSGAAASLSGVIFRTRSAWSLLLNRTRFDYRSEVGDPLKNSIVGAVVGWIATNFPEAPVRIIREDTVEIAYSPAATGPGAMLRLLEKPNEKYSGVVQWMATLVDYIRGDAYWLKLRAPNGRVKELWWLPAFMVEPKWDERTSSSFIEEYWYTVDGIAYAIKPRDIVHFRNGLNPNNPRKGRDQLEPLFREIFTDDEAANFTASMLRNLGVPGVILAPANTGLAVGKIDAEGVKDRFKETFGGDKRGEPMVMTAPTEIKVLSWSPQEMDLKSLRRIPEERISANLHVPAGVAQLGAGLDRNTFTNYGEARVAAYTEGVIPLHRLFAAELEVQLLTEFASAEQIEREHLDVWFDWRKVAAMQAFADGVWKRYEGAATKGLVTRADFKRAVGLVVEGGDSVYVVPNNYSFVPAGGSQPPAGIPAPRQLLGGAGAGEVPLLSTSELVVAGEVRCEGCNRLLAEQATPPYRFTCGRCKHVTASEAAA